MALNEVPADFGRRHIGAPSDGDLTFNLGQKFQPVNLTELHQVDGMSAKCKEYFVTW